MLRCLLRYVPLERRFLLWLGLLGNLSPLGLEGQSLALGSRCLETIEFLGIDLENSVLRPVTLPWMQRLPSGLLDLKSRQVVMQAVRPMFLNHEVSEGLLSIGRIVSENSIQRPSSSIIANENHKYGYLNMKGELVIDFNFSEAQEFKESRALVFVNKRWNHIKHNGELISNEGYGWGSNFSQGRARVFDDARNDYLYIDLEGNPLFQKRFDENRRFSEGFAAVGKKLGGPHILFGYINLEGEEIINFRFQDAREFSEQLAPVKVAGLWGYADAGGHLKIPAAFFDALPFKDGLAAVQDQVTGNYGFIDRVGRLKLPPHYRYTSGFSEGRAVVQTPNGLYGVIDKSGELVVPYECSRIDEFRDGFAYFEKGAQLGYFDRLGNIAWSVTVSDTLLTVR